jgi:hypothetical protein
MSKQRNFQYTNYVPLSLKILANTSYSCYSLLGKAGHNRQLIDSSTMLLSIDIVDHRLSVYLRRGVGVSSLLVLLTGPTSRFIGKEI